MPIRVDVRRQPPPTACTHRYRGRPAILGAWIGGYTTSDALGVLFFALAAGAALQVVVEVGRFIARRAPGGLSSGYAVGGFLAGIIVMYATGLLAG